jgi:hypothetical protein
MPQLQKPIPLAAALFRKSMRVVIDFLPRGANRSGRQPAFRSSVKIAKAQAIEQSYLIGIAALCLEM